MELKKIELTARTQGGDDETGDLDSAGATATSRYNSLTSRTKRFGDTLRHVLPRMPSEHAELSQFFDSFEKLFKMYQVPADV